MHADPAVQAPHMQIYFMQTHVDTFGHAKNMLRDAGTNQCPLRCWHRQCSCGALAAVRGRQSIYTTERTRL